MRLTRSEGRLVLGLDAAEAQLLTALLDELDALLDADEPSDQALQRLKPAAYRDDPEAEAEYRTLTDAALRGQRDERIAACRADLRQPQRVALDDPAAAQRWLQTLNDLRLALGTRLGVTQEEERHLDPRDPASQQWLVYFWLTELQDALVQSLID